ncbi:bifunctional diguanylate cyclase/phosphodiesterase [Rhodoblastus sp.]|uniref:sensor domain-containing protein n=1 Tax=Rhodoblastus sp. TaxID=1962975 RepID=UPI00262BB517|nr:bifunctional diguanylate cyclase/phosphodiesterase [Rhodoblastus sp.]
MRKDSALKASLGYAAFGTAWIFFSDKMLALLLGRDAFVVLSSYKGFAFVAVTAVLLFVTLRRLDGRAEAPGYDSVAFGRSGIVPVAALLSLGIIGIAAIASHDVTASLERRTLDEARSIVRLKADDLGRWLEAKEAAAALLAADVRSNPALDQIELRGLNRDSLENRLQHQAAGFNFVAVDLIDFSGRSLLSRQESASAIVTAARTSFRTNKPALVDLHREPGVASPRFGFTVPLRGSAQDRPLAVYAELAARDYLYPFVRFWPRDHASGSGVLARREGDDVLFLSDLSHNEGAAMRLRLSYRGSQVPIVRFIRGETDAARGVDPFGVRIFAAGAKVPGTDWELTARIAEADVFAEKAWNLRTIGLVAALAIAAVWVVAGFYWQGQQLAHARAEQRLNSRFQVTFEQAAVAMMHVGLDGAILRVNRRACEMFGYRRDELLGTNAMLLCAPAYRAETAEYMAALRSGAMKEYHTERQCLRKNGTAFEVAAFASVAPGERGDSDYLMVVIEDIGQRKAVEDALRASEERLRFALEGAKEGLWDWQVETDEAYFAPAWKAMLGYADEEIENRGSAWRCLVEPEGAKNFRRQFLEVRSGERETIEFETRLRHKDGYWIDVLSRALPLIGPSGRIVRIVGTDLDITTRKTEEASARLAAAFFESTHEGIVITDHDKNIVRVNPAFEAITGYSEKEMRGNNMRVLQSGRHDRAFYASLWKSVNDHGFWQGEIWNRRKGGEIFPERLSIGTVRDPSGAVVNYIGVFSDIKRLKQSESRLEFLAHHDPLTSLPNRTLLRLRIDHAIARSRREGKMGAVLFLDLDRFKTVNDSLGHVAGDQLLVQAAQRWTRRLRTADTLARIGGDEFVVLLEDVAEPHDAAVVAQSLMGEMAAPFSLPSRHDAFVGLSVGVSLFPANGQSPDELIQHADSALYLAKNSGGSTVRFYSDSLTSEASERLEMEAGIRRGLHRDEFVLHFQPLVSIKDRRMVGVEALVRWGSPGGLIPPDQFIPLAEKTGLIVPLGEWVLRDACARMKAWRDSGADIQFIAVNMSPVQLGRADICATVKAILDETGLPPDCLELEITESALLNPAGGAEAKLRDLRAFGVRVSLDDFGAGHSSLFFLQRFPINKLKLDRSFIQDIPGDPTSMEIATAIIRLARALNIKALAEGVETEAQIDFLAATGCDLAQGYFFDKPLSELELLERMRISGKASKIAV